MNQSQRTKGSRSQKQKRNKSKGGSTSRRSDATRASKTISVPSAMGRVQEIGSPNIRSIGGDTFRVTHREYIADVLASDDFIVTSYPIQPASPITFPWLSNLARNFEKYRFRKLRFSFETSAPTIVGGSIMLVPDYDALDAAPATKTAALEYADSVRGAPWMSFSHNATKKNLRALPQYYTRPGDVPDGADLKTYDVGNLHVCSASSGSLSTPYVGELWIDYDIDLITPGRASYAVPAMVVAADSTGASWLNPLPSDATTVSGGLQEVVETVFDGTTARINFKRPLEAVVSIEAEGSMNPAGTFASDGGTATRTELVGSLPNSAHNRGAMQCAVKAKAGDYFQYNLGGNDGVGDLWTKIRLIVTLANYATAILGAV